MSTRRQFLKSMGACTAAAFASPLLLQRCAGGLASYRTRLSPNGVLVPKSQAATLRQPNGILMVHVRGLQGPVVLRNVDSEIVALSTICTHRGCEVRPMPDFFQCPCHGSEYDLDGAVLAGPARMPLQRFEVRETPEAYLIVVS